MGSKNLDNLSKTSSMLYAKLEDISEEKEKAEVAKLIAELEREIAEARKARSGKFQVFVAVLVAASAIFAYAVNLLKPIIEKDTLISKKDVVLMEKNVKIQEAELKLEKIKFSEVEEKNKHLSKTLEKQKEEIDEVKIRAQARIAIVQRQIEKLTSQLETAKLESLDFQRLSSELAYLSDTLNHTMVITVNSDSDFYPTEEAHNGVSGFIKVSFEIDRAGNATAFQTIAQSTDGNFGAATINVINDYLSNEPIQPDNVLRVSDKRWEAMVIYKAK